MNDTACIVGSRSMGAYGLVWSGLKKLLVRDGRAGRGDFVLKGVIPLWLSLFVLLNAPAFPVLVEISIGFIIAALFFSRTGLAMAVRRTHDLAMDETYLTSFRRQSLAYFQAFIVLMFATSYLTVSAGNHVAALIIALVAATAMTIILLGGPKYVMALTTTPRAVLPNGLATPATAKALADKPNAEALRKALPREVLARQMAHPLQSKVRGVQVQNVPESTPKTRPVYKTKAGAPQPREPGLAQPQYPKPIVRKRKRGAIGEWT